jgi:hypothetical protein
MLFLVSKHLKGVDCSGAEFMSHQFQWLFGLEFLPPGGAYPWGPLDADLHLARTFHTRFPERRLAAGLARSERPKPVANRRSPRSLFLARCEISGLGAVVGLWRLLPAAIVLPTSTDMAEQLQAEVQVRTQRGTEFTLTFADPEFSHILQLHE